MKKLIVILMSAFLLSGCCSGIIKATKGYATTVKDVSSASSVFLKDIRCKDDDKDCKASLEALKKMIDKLKETSEGILKYKKKW